MNRNYSDISYAESPFGTLSEFMSKTFGWMFAGLLVTFLVGIGAVTTGADLPAHHLGPVHPDLHRGAGAGVRAVGPGADAAAVHGHGHLLRLRGAQRPESELHLPRV